MLKLRHYAHMTKSKKWYGLCLTLNIAVQAETLVGLKNKMDEAVASYFCVVFELGDEDSVPDLIPRYAPLRDWLKYFIHLYKGETWSREVVFHAGDNGCN